MYLNKCNKIIIRTIINIFYSYLLVNHKFFIWEKFFGFLIPLYIFSLYRICQLCYTILELKI